MTKQRYTIELRISGEDVIPEKITEKMQLEPCLSRKAGDRFGKNRHYKYGVWSYAGAAPGKEWDSIDEALTHLIGELESRSHLILSYAKQFDVFWWCGHFFYSSGSESKISVPVLNRLANFGVPLIIDSYLSDLDDHVA